MSTRTLLLLPVLFACHPWQFPTRGSYTFDDPLWDPAVVAASDGVYVRLPAAGALVRVLPDGSWSQVDLNGASPDDLLLGPDDATLLVRASWTTCADDDPKIRTESDCRSDDLDTAHEIDLVKDGAVIGTLGDVPPQFNRVTFNADGSMGAAYLDFSDPTAIDVDLMLNLTQVSFFEMGSTVVSHNVTVGFAAESVLFTSGQPRAVVLSRSQVAVVDLNTWAVTVTYPLTLDPDAAVVPTDVALTPDGRYAMVSVAGQADLYVLDLEQESIDLVELDGVPSDLYVDAVNDRTVIVYSSVRQVDVLEHEYFELSTYPLEEPSTAVLPADGEVVLYNANGYHDVYRFDAATGDVVEYRAENPVMDLHVTDDHRFAVATLDRESTGAGGVSGFYDAYYGLDIFDLSDDRAGTALALEGRPVGLALSARNGENHALVLMEGVDSLLDIDLLVGTNAPVELLEPPLGLAAQPDGTFVIPQDSAEGLVSFFDAATGEITDVIGFALTDILPDDTLPRRGEE